MLRSILPAQFTRSVSRQGGLHAPELFWAAERYSIALSAHDRLGSLALSLFVFSALQPTNVWHSGILFLVWIFGLWISWPTLNACSRGLRGLVLASVAAIVLLQDAQTAAAWVREVREPYSSGLKAAAIVLSSDNRN
ncbi:MAG: hypothetical protein EKK50_12685 [Sphingomonadaceae bacterium]|nr:MAG: hypothetical protein EKK50_12685 [Sphingomonadaceae bacterium]